MSALVYAEIPARPGYFSGYRKGLLLELSTAITVTAMSLQITGTELPTVNLYSEMGFICLLQRNVASVIYSLRRDG
jgi:hypothetical protein